jgi:sulfur-carrier protein
MKVNILFFGQLSDITGVSKLIVEQMKDTSSLVELLNKEYPKLSEVKFMIAVDKKIVTANTILNDQCHVALLPPFSGG